MGRFAVTRGGDAPAEPGWREVDPFGATFELALRDGLAEAAIDDTFETAEPDGTTALERLERALQLGRATAFERDEPRPRTEPGQPGHDPFDPSAATPLAELAPPEPAPSEPEVVEPPRPTWILIQLVDCDDKPIANRPFRLRLADGTIRQGMVGANGEIRFDDVTAGLCTLVLPTNDEKEWEPAQTG